jgi:hypothetical protein
MSDVFKLVQYFKHLDHFPRYSQVRKLFFPGEPPVIHRGGSQRHAAHGRHPGRGGSHRLAAPSLNPLLFREPAMLHGYNPPARFLPYLSWTEIATLPDKANTVIVLPTGSTEQHGPHLPCAVDTVIAAGVVGHALARLPEAVPAYAMAPITYGKSEEHLHFPGTVTLAATTLLETMNADRRVGLPRAFASCSSSTATAASRR